MGFASSAAGSASARWALEAPRATGGCLVCSAGVCIRGSASLCVSVRGCSGARVVGALVAPVAVPLSMRSCGIALSLVVRVLWRPAVAVSTRCLAGGGLGRGRDKGGAWRRRVALVFRVGLRFGPSQVVKKDKGAFVLQAPQAPTEVVAVLVR